MDGEWLRRGLGRPDLLVVDPRPPVRYFGGHIRGAVNVRADLVLAALLRDDVEAACGLLGRGGVGPEVEVIVYDAGDGQLACSLAWVLEYLGHPRVGLLAERLDGWLARFGEKGYKPTPPTPREFRAKPVDELRATAGVVLRGLGRLRLLDVRSEEEYRGELALHPRAGRIPGAVNVPWTALLSEGDRIFRGEGELRQLLAARGVTPADEVVVYCSEGSRACVGYYALRLAGFRRVSVYDKSFGEWASRPELPVER